MKKYISNLLSANPLCGISSYTDTLNLSNGNISIIIKKLVLDGTEEWTRTGTLKFALVLYDTPDRSGEICYCSHFIGTSKSSLADLLDGECSTQFSGNRLGICYDNITTADDFKTFLQTEYSNGTPVTIWYVLATSTTETITVPTGLTGTVNGYLTQTGIPTPTAPIYPTANPVTMWADYTPNKYNNGWTTANGQPEKYNGGWS